MDLLKERLLLRREIGAVHGRLAGNVLWLLTVGEHLAGNLRLLRGQQARLALGEILHEPLRVLEGRDVIQITSEMNGVAGIIELRG